MFCLLSGWGRLSLGHAMRVGTVHVVFALRVVRAQLPSGGALADAVRVERARCPLLVLVPEGVLLAGGGGYSSGCQGYRAGEERWTRARW